MSEIKFLSELTEDINNNTVLSQLSTFKNSYDDSTDKGIIFVSQKKNDNNLGGYITDENLFPTYRFYAVTRTGAEIEAKEESKFISYNDEVMMFCNPAKISMKKTPTEITTENNIKIVECNLVTGGIAGGGLGLTDITSKHFFIYEYSGEYYLAFYEKPVLSNDEHICILMNLKIDWEEKANAIMYSSVNDKNNLVFKDKNNEVPNYFYLEENGYRKAILNLRLTINGAKKIYKGNDIPTNSSINSVLFGSQNGRSYLLRSGLSEEDLIPFGTKKITDIRNIDSSTKYIGYRYIVEKKSNDAKEDIKIKSKYGVIADSEDKEKIIGVILNFSGGEALVYYINNTTNGIKKYENCYLTINASSNGNNNIFYHTAATNQFISAIKEPSIKEKTINDIKDSVLFFAANQSTRTNSIDNYWADQYSGSLPCNVELSSDDRSSLTDKIPAPSNFIRYRVITYNKNGEVKNNIITNSIYNILQKNGEQPYFVDIKANSLIGANEKPNAEIELYKPIFEWKIERDDERNASSNLAMLWANNSYETIINNANNEAAIGWALTALKNNYLYPLVYKGFFRGKEAAFYTDNNGYLKVGYDFEYNTSSEDIKKCFKNAKNDIIEKGYKVNGYRVLDINDDVVKNFIFDDDDVTSIEQQHIINQLKVYIKEKLKEIAEGIKKTGTNIKYSVGQLTSLTVFYIISGVNYNYDSFTNQSYWGNRVENIISEGKITDSDTIKDINAFNFYEEEETANNTDTNITNKPKFGSYLYDITCYAIRVYDTSGLSSERKLLAENIKINTFYKNRLFQEKEKNGEKYYSINGNVTASSCIFTYSVKQTINDEITKAEETAANGTKKLPYVKVKEFVDSFKAIRTKQEPTTQKFVDVEGYYDFYSGMTPYIEAGFRDEGENFNYINSITHPYFVSLKVEDDGVKKIELQLYDKDFGSYQKGILYKDGKAEKDKIYSLETLIKQALKMPVTNIQETNSGNDGYSETGEETIENGYLKFSEAKNYSPVNLKVRFGYADCNYHIGNNDSSYYSKKGVDSTKRDYRWWDVKNGSDVQAEKVQVSKYIKSKNDPQFQTGTTMNFINVPEKQRNEKDTSVSQSEKEKSFDQTTKSSYIIDCMITGYKTSLQPNGILYTLTAIEAKEAKLIKTRILQRFATISSYPEEALYLLMKMFNENDRGNVTTCPVKLYIVEDNDNSEGLINEIDYTKLSDIEKEKYVKKEIDIGDIDPKKYKTIEISLGGETALRNYINDKNKPRLYKNVYSLLNEFCAACPPLKIKRDENLVTTNINGEEITVENMPEASRRLSWFSCAYTEGKISANDYVAIFFYYRKPEKLPLIRRYTWGPENVYQTVVTDLSIENANEFAVFSGIESFDPAKGKVVSRTKEGRVYSKKIEDDKIVGAYEGITSNSTANNNYEMALSNCMYKGSIKILGDPSYLFTGLNMQPCTYPIYLRVLVPLNTFEQKSSDTAEDDEAIREMDRKYGSRRLYGNQQQHEMSGYYVINKITHNINSSGFTTTLDVMSYPGIQKDVEL